ncbi:Clavesin-1 [Orchesella cincta]|uniref:Clavesin-1 n=1 Tax=Orchesella cincta TaxID=48709 RepID=A0A1D2M8D5_ORCCI|nr:Clavesin-1 [Orchesella cincta]
METKLNEQDGLAALKCLIKEFLNSGEGSPKVRDYISSVAQDDSILLIYLRGRKHRVNQAFDTLKRNADVRFDEYPEVFPEEVPDALSTSQKGCLWLDETRDKFGRRIIVSIQLAYPIKLKGLYYVNVPSYVKYVFKIIQPFLSKKLKERMVIMGTGERFETLHKIVSPDLLPKFLGGVYENETAFELVHTIN